MPSGAAVRRNVTWLMNQYAVADIVYLIAGTGTTSSLSKGRAAAVRG